MPFIFGLRGNTEIIDVSKTVELLEAAEVFLRDAVGAGKRVMFVGTRPSLAEMTKQAAVELGTAHVTVRWIGGTLTNFNVISKRLDAFRDLVEQEKSGELKEKYTKAERVRFQRKIAKLQEELGGIKDMSELPDILIISSLRSNKLAAIEGGKKGITTIAIADTDCDPTLVDYPIPANDDALPSVALILNRLKAAIAEGQAKAASDAAKAQEDAVKAQEDAKIKEQKAKEAEVAEKARNKEQEEKKKEAAKKPSDTTSSVPEGSDSTPDAASKEKETGSKPARPDDSGHSGGKEESDS